jgi:anaerobic carbon-monoxide dehydrogenase catalytic subunit
MVRNFGRMVATGSASHNDHGFNILELFRGIAKGKIKDFKIDDTRKLERIARSIGIEVEGKEVMELAAELEKTFPIWTVKCRF